MIITIPFPPSILRPNDRTHWRKKNPIKASYRTDCSYFAMEKPVAFPANGPLYLHITFYPPNNRWDWDGMVSAAKAGFDGLAIGWKVNDKRFTPTLSFCPADPKNPRIEVKVL